MFPGKIRTRRLFTVDGRDLTEGLGCLGEEYSRVGSHERWSGAKVLEWSGSVGQQSRVGVSSWDRVTGRVSVRVVPETPVDGKGGGGGVPGDGYSGTGRLNYVTEPHS